MEALNEFEIRSLKSEVQLTGKKAVGYAVVYDSPSQVMRHKDGRLFVEYIRQGAFAKTINDGSEIKADFAHDGEAVIARRSKGTLKVASDAKGIAVEIDLPETTLGADLRAMIEHGDIDGMSFQYSPNPGGEKWTKLPTGALWQRDITDATLQRVTLTCEPAFLGTEVALRSMAAAKEAEKQAQPTEQAQPENEQQAQAVEPSAEQTKEKIEVQSNSEKEQIAESVQEAGVPIALYRLKLKLAELD